MHKPRDNHAGADWLITSRGLSKRAVFETREDVERFSDGLETLNQDELCGRVGGPKNSSWFRVSRAPALHAPSRGVGKLPNCRCPASNQ